MQLVIALGSNLGNRHHYLRLAKWMMRAHFEYLRETPIIETDPVDYLDQPKFLNQLIEFKTPANLSSIEILDILQEIEIALDRVRLINKGPRTIDLDIIFNGSEQCSTDRLILPHPAWNKRQFILDLLEYFK